MTLFSGRNLDSGDDDDEEENEDREDDEEDNNDDEDKYVDTNEKKSNKKKLPFPLTRKGSRSEMKGGGDGSDDEGQNDDGNAEFELSDATVKLLRLYANLSINESIGYALAKRKDSTKVILIF